jgi:hypothetical protein
MKVPKLVLNRDTLRRLSRDALGQVHGGSDDRGRPTGGSDTFGPKSCHTNGANVSAGNWATCGCPSEDTVQSGDGIVVDPLGG